MSQGVIRVCESDLPVQLVELRDLIGLAATLSIVKHFGGRHIDVPNQYRDTHILVRIVGHAAASKIAEQYAGTRINVAKMAYALRVQRNIEVAKRYEGGASVAQLAIDYDLTERQIWNILKRPEARKSTTSPQISLL